MNHEPDNAQAAPSALEWPPLLDGVRAGDEEAARAVVERLYHHIRKIVLAHLPRRDDPEDVMQEIFMKMFSKLDQFSGAVPFENWVSRIALLTCIDRLRRQRARPELRWADLSEEEQKLVQGVAEETGAAPQAAESARELVLRLLGQLKPEDQWIIRWLDLEQKTVAEVCAMTGWNNGVARIRAFRARQKLRSLYRQIEKQTP
jgi:RNA polymerase sigma-70 factor (ECF subfamily)